MPRYRATIAITLLALVVAVDRAKEAPPAFEVASVKRDVSGQPGPLYKMFPQFTVQRATLKDLIVLAWELHDFQVSGGPGWINSDRYNIDAKAEVNPVFTQEYRHLVLRRLQKLLNDRFHLTVHRARKELPVYELTVANGGPKLQPPSCLQREPGDLTVAPGKTMTDYCGFSGFFGRGSYQASDGTIANLAGALSLPLGRSVVDKTAIAGRFRIQLTYNANSLLPNATDASPVPDFGPDIVTALREQLGLKLESAKGPVEVLVIDHVEKPSEN